MPNIPQVSITIADNGASAALSVPLASVQLKIGTAVGGTVNQPYATSSPTALQTQFVGGPLVEAGGLVCQAGNTVVAISIPVVTAGTATAVQPTVPGGGSSTVTTTLDSINGAWDTYYVKLVVLTGGTVGTSGIVVQVSLDAGRNFGSPISLGTQSQLYLGTGSLTSRVPGGTGVRVNFGGGTLVAGDSYQFATVGPQGNAAGYTAALAAFQASQYGVAGVGSIHIVGDLMHGGTTSSDVASIQTQLQSGVAIYEFQRAIVELRDVMTPVAWGGSGETEAAWLANLSVIASGLTAESRICSDGGYYNMTSPYANPAGGLPSYRRSLAWAHAVRRTQVPLERRAGRVKDGPYQSVVVNPATDPTDGFVYHDERTNPGLNAARIASAMTWPKKGSGFYQCQEPLLCPPGSQFVELVIGNVLDAACDIAYATGVEEISDDLTVQVNGTLDTVALNTFQGQIQNALNQGLIQTPLASDVQAVVSASANVLATGIIPVTINVTPKGYVNAISEVINLNQGG